MAWRTNICATNRLRKILFENYSEEAENEGFKIRV